MKALRTRRAAAQPGQVPTQPQPPGPQREWAMASETDTIEATEGAGALRRLFRQRTVRTVVAVYAFLVVLIFLSKVVSSSYGSLGFVRSVVAVAAFTAVAGFGQFVVVLTGGLDLAIPGVITLSGVMLTNLTLGSNSKAAWAVPAVLALGGAIGAVNGLGIVYTKLSPVVMTLATNVILSGVVLVYTNGTPKGYTPKDIVRVIQGNVGGFPYVIIVLLVFTAIGVLVMNKTSFGRRVYAVGSNRQVAYLSGVRVNGVLISVYAISGLCAALTGVMLDGYGNQSYLSMGDPYLLLSLAAVVVGGVSILGGRGLYIGVLGGAIILQTISTTLSGTSLPEAVKQIVFAVAILAAVVAARQQTARST